jgi:DNA mismatch repair protein MutS
VTVDTPMMRQYRSVKDSHPDAIVLFRMGDFYEMFHDDAVVASRVLGLTLTTRDKGKAQPVPMAGVPWHAADGYIARLLRAGYKVTVCDQVEDPRKAKGLVKREVTEIVTPGTVLAESMLARDRDAYLAAIDPSGQTIGLAALSLSSGDFWVAEVDHERLLDEIDLLAPSEILLPQSLRGREGELIGALDPSPAITWIDDWRWDLVHAKEALAAQFRTAGLDGFGVSHLAPGLRAAGAILDYLKSVGRDRLEHVTAIVERRRAEHLVLDEMTRRHLDILETSSPRAAGEGTARRGVAPATLVAAVDRTRTPMGARLLRRWLAEPLVSVEAIRARHSAVRELVERPARVRLRAALSDVRDLERAVARLVCEKAAPRDLAEMRAALRAAEDVAEALTAVHAPLLAGLRDGWDGCLDVAAAIEDALLDPPGASPREGDVLRDGYDAELDALRAVTRDGKEWVVAFQERERARSGIGSLKLGFNRVFGYYIEVTRPHRDRVPPDYVRKQTLAGAERFVTEELSRFEERVLEAQSRIGEVEETLFAAFRSDLARHGPRLRALAAALATIDVVASFAEIAAERGYVEPAVDDGLDIEIVDGRHPVLEPLLPKGTFIPNDLSLIDGASRIHLITGPNMAGKSTFLRQNALLVILAQAGSFVPAASARIGVVDRIFTRIGARDDLARGQSTFLVEMIETARILHQATARSFLLLDEVGRGTSTFDGLSIAWAVVEHLHERSAGTARTLFATHYHELTDLALTLPRVANFHVDVRETEDGIVFLRRVAAGATDRSYGIHVAERAGLPRSVIERARELLQNLEAGGLSADGLPTIARGERAPRAPRAHQLPLVVAPDEAPAAPRASALERALRGLDLDRMTPLQALEALADLKRRLPS